MQSRRRFLGHLRTALGIALIAVGGRPAAATDDIVLVDGWILRRSDLDLMR
jgi:hypothetical protein